MRDRAPLALLALVLAGCVSSGGTTPFDPFVLSFGASRSEVIASIIDGGQRPLTFDDGSLLIEATILPDVYEMQRTVLLFDDAGGLERAHVRIEPETGAREADLFRLAHEVRKRLVARLGPPAWERRDGTAEPRELFDALANGELLTEWHAPSGVVRAGIPRTIHGRRHVEIVISRTPLARGEAYWGIDVR